jgi:ketosteroid isomerase-like protein
MSNVEVLKQAYKAFAEGNLEAAMTNWHPDMDWDDCAGFPYIEGDAIFKGIPAIVEGVFVPLPEQYENFEIEITEFVDGGDKIVMVGYYKGIWKATGKTFRANATHAWTFKDGKASRFFLAVDTAEIINP